MNDQQVYSLIAACAIVMVPLGAALGVVGRWLKRRVDGALPPRHLKPVGKERRRGGA